RYARQNDAPDSDVAVSSNPHRCGLDRAEEYRHFASQLAVAARQYNHARPYAYVLSDVNAARAVKKTVLSDPNIIFHDHLVLVLTREHRVMADVDVAAEPDILGMKYH